MKAAYLSQYYENVTTFGEVTTSYYLGSKLIAVKKGSDLSYIMQDHLGSTRGTVDIGGTLESTISYFNFGGVRFSSGSLPTDKKFTGQRQDSTGLYYYGARYYDPIIGRFISPDTVVQNPANPQTLNLYSYCLNNPLKFIDPSGHTVIIDGQDIGQLYADTAEYDFNTWSQYADVMTSLEFEAYDVFRFEEYACAQEWEQASNNISIIAGDIDYRLDSQTVAVGVDFQITLNTGLEGANDFYLAGALKDASYKIDPVFTDTELQQIYAVPNIIGGAVAMAGGVALMAAPYLGVPVGPLTQPLGVMGIYGGWDSLSTGWNSLVGKQELQELPSLPPFLGTIIKWFVK